MILDIINTTILIAILFFVFHAWWKISILSHSLKNNIIFRMANILTEKRSEAVDDIMEQLFRENSEDTASSFSPVITENQSQNQNAIHCQQRERLIVAVCGGQSRDLLGQQYTTAQIEALSDKNVEKMYKTYEARLGASMTKSIGRSAIQTYARVAALFMPIDNEKELAHDLNNDPFLNSAIRGAAAEAYHIFGSWLAPLSVALITGRHINVDMKTHIEQTENIDIAQENECRGESNSISTEKEPTEGKSG